MALTSNVAVRDGGKTSEQGFSRFLNKIAATTNSGVIGSSDLAVTQDGSPDMNVTIATGDLVIPYLDYFFHAFFTATNQLPSVITPPGSNSQVFSVVSYVDLSVVSSASNNNPGAAKFMAVGGTASATPVPPSGATIQAAVGSGNPYVILANITVASGASSIVNANISDQRPVYKLFGNINTPVIYGEYDNGNSGASSTIDWSKGDHQKVTLNNNSVSIYYSNAKTGQKLTLILIQDGTGNRVPTLPSPGSKYPNGVAPTFSTAASAVDEIIVDYDGSVYNTQFALNFS